MPLCYMLWNTTKELSWQWVTLNIFNLNDFDNKIRKYFCFNTRQTIYIEETLTQRDKFIRIDLTWYYIKLDTKTDPPNKLLQNSDHFLR